MAEFALGLTKTAVAGTVSTVKSAIEEEANLRVSVQDDLVFITGEFEMMQSFLSASSTGEGASKNQVVRTWVRQLRYLAFDVEDCVEVIIHLDEPSRWDFIQRLASPVLVCMGWPQRPLDQAVTEIKRLKARVEDVSARNARYNLIKGDDSPADAHHQPTSSTSSSKRVTGALQVLVDVWKKAGKLGRHTAIDLKRLIDSHVSQLQVISLWRAGGAADVGGHAPPPPNTYVHMMKKAYNDPEICRRFENRAWVKLSALHPFNPVEFINNLLTQFTSRNHDDDRHYHREDSIPKLLLQLKQHKYLVFIEQELTTVADWDAIRMYLPDGNNGSRVVVSTNSLGIALVCTGDPYQVSELKRFSHDRGLYALFPKGCGHRVGMGELIWQLRHCGVISLFWGLRFCGEYLSYDDEAVSQFKKEFRDMSKLKLLDKSRVLDAVKFERCFWYDTKTDDQKFVLAHLAAWLVCRSYPEDAQESVSEQLYGMSQLDIVERCRALLTEHDYLIFIENLESSKDWDLIKHFLLCESTRGCIVVFTAEDKQVATHCVDHDEYRALDLRYLMKCFNEQYHEARDNISEEDVYVEREAALAPYEFRKFLTSGMLSVWGIAGVGKTAMVRENYNFVVTMLGTMHGWVDVPYPFDLTDLCRRLLLDFYSGDVDAMESAAIGIMEGQDPIQLCWKILHDDEFLLIIDDLRSKQDWDMIKATLLSHPFRGTVIVITRDEGIAAHCTDSKENILNVKGLKDDVAIDLFNKIAFKGKQPSELHPKTEEISKILVSKCGGLPEVIVAIGKSVHAEDLQSCWLESINSDFMGILEDFSEFPSLRGLFCWMQSYFNACSDELKPCIFYITVFPADQSIRWRRLLRRWIAEGYSSAAGGTAEDNGKKLLSELMDLSILYQEQLTTRKISYKVNGFFREYIKSQPMEDNLVFALEGSRSPSLRLTVQHLSIYISWDRDVIVFNDIDLSRLRSLTVFGEWRSFLISDKMKILRVLDLEGTSTSPGTMSVTDKDLEEIGKLLPRLKFLSLRGCMNITCLPDSMGDMRQLQTLDVRYTSIVELPSTITKLEKLQYIRAGTSTDTSLLLLQLQAKTSPSPPRPQEDGHGGTSPFLQATASESVLQLASTRITEAWKRKAQDLVASSRNSWWKLKNQLDLRTRRRVAANGGGVEVGHAAAQGIGVLTHLYTLGVVNVAGGKGAFLVLKELKKLTQLCKLGLSGINRKNWSQLCEAISGNLHHLESLSLQLMLLKEDGDSYQFACFDNIDKPPKSLKHLKVLYPTTGVRAAHAARIGRVWLNQLPNLQRLVQELMISTEEDIHLVEQAEETGEFWECRFLIKPMEEHLSFVRPDDITGLSMEPGSLRIECSSTLPDSKVTFGKLIVFSIEAISIHCCCSSSAGTSAGASSSCNLKIAGLESVNELKEVMVTGTYRDDIKRDLREQLEKLENKPVLK